jgi:signal transduction histidine kinase
MKASSLRRRVVLAIVATTIVTSMLFGLMTFIFAYRLEDQLFEGELAREIDRQQAAWQQDQKLVPPMLPYIRIYRDEAALPADLAPQVAKVPQQREFFGTEGRHYHIARFTLPGADGGAAMAVAEGSRFLLVRPVRNSLILFLTGLSIFVATVAALLGWWLASRALSPLSRLAAELSGAGQTTGGQAVPRIDPQTYPANEIGVLAGALAEAFERIRGFVAREQDFTRDASHELRTPLAVIGGAAEILVTNPAVPESALPALRRIETASADIAQALDLLLALARENKAGAGVARLPVALLPTVEKAIASASVRFPASPIAVTVDVIATAAVTVDATLLQLVLNNLVGNAFQHASGGELLVAGDSARLLIADTGPGFGNVADPFAPFDKQPQSAGSGLGLAIVRRLCDAAGITLSWRSNPNGSGTQLSLDFSRPGAVSMQ